MINGINVTRVTIELINCIEIIELMIQLERKVIKKKKDFHENGYLSKIIL